MAEAKLAPNLPKWMVDHANRYLASGGTDGHMFKPTQPGRPDVAVPSLMLTTVGRKSGEKCMFPLYYGETGNSYFVIASKGGAPEHPGWYRNVRANPDVEVQVGTKKLRARARTASGYWLTEAMRSVFLVAEGPITIVNPHTGILMDMTAKPAPHGAAIVRARGDIFADRLSRDLGAPWEAQSRELRRRADALPSRLIPKLGDRDSRGFPDAAEF